jgi:hypothetical protein
MDCGQRVITKKGGKDNNHSHHAIIEYVEVSKKRMFEPNQESELIEVYDPDDIEDRLHVTREQANQLIEKGYKRFVYGQIVLDDPNNIWKEIK